MSGNQVTKAADVTMAQASSAQREPSMEEILASIRRIIEDSDQGRKPGDGLQRFDSPGERNEGAVIEVDAFRSELRGRIDRDPALRLAESALSDAAATLGEVKAQIPRDADVEKPDAGGEAAAQRVAEVATREALGSAAGADGNPEPKAPSFDEARVPSAVEAEAARGQNTPPASMSRSALISEQPGRQVAAAFSELSEAFAASRRKSFDELAEEMLRPMLQDWLDNNLPTLVERLVREEIERVARGS